MVTALVLTMVLAFPQAAPPPPPPAPPRPPGSDRPMPKGTASVRGRVTSAETGRPLRRAQIRLTAPELPQGRALTASTDIEGEYEIAEVPAGRYTITVTRSSHLQAIHGQQRHGEPGRPLEIAEGARVEKIDFALLRAGMITGRITDETGEPAAGALVLAMQRQFFRGRHRLVFGTVGARTDDTGFYRLLAVPPGDYVISATLRETWVSDVDPKVTLAFAPTFCPGTLNAADAQRVSVGIGQEVGSVDFPLVPVRAATISGTATGSDGSPFAGATVMLTSEVLGPAGGIMSMAGSARVSPDGAWRIPDLSPGEYRLRVSSPNKERPESAYATVDVQGVDLEGIVLAADAGSVITGEVVVDGGGTLPSTPAPLYVRTQPVVADMSPSLQSDEDGRVREDGTFAWRSRAGRMLFRLSALPRGWAVKSIEIDGRDHAEVPLDVRGGQRLNGVRITITSRFPALTGRLTDEKGTTAEGTVVLFPEDDAKWIEGTGALRSTRPDQSGVYRFDSVRPGEYLIVALDTIQQWQTNDPEFLATLRDTATKVTVQEGGSESLDLRIRK